ncbi:MULTISPECIES: N-formylglutamate amidohydrolase [Bizionia]|uniref:N-formylglutamate amidohydrolase n=1 Tax=Bizionia algoritergicola TaxID=291187 RepID=A0A5D0QVK3_9FLAO|nr:MULTISPECIES: N-formylglutamate amidohydrolase [Bizionia]OBX21518.1 N-formylglutamate amidohydrolase [Bizionia sp. APA-3]TYB72826.1 N-formylglutamate amidohydrolase [Bizionia algoritergicola]
MKLILTCEHGGNHIPKEYEGLFINQEAILNAHRGFDLGALDVFQSLKPIADFSKFSNTSRLLVELNRSLHHKDLFSKFTRELSKAEKQKIIAQYYKPYRDAVEGVISQCIQEGETVIHVSIHSFTPIWKNVERRVDIGLLYDSRIPKEKDFCKVFKTEILRISNNYEIRFNQPYLGKADGFPTYLRKQFSENYIGVELEINQKYSSNNQMADSLKTLIFGAIKQCKLE